jgi:hypothetical protein
MVALYINGIKTHKMIKLNKLWNILDKDNIVIMLFSIPLFIFLLIGYLKEDLIKIIMPIFLYWSSIIFVLTAFHAVKRRVFPYFSRGSVFAGKRPISFWILVGIQFFLAAIFFSIATIYIIDFLQTR